MARKAEVAAEGTTGQTQPGSTNENIIDLTAAPIKGTIYLDWSIKNAGDISGYYVYRANSSGGYTVPLTDFPILKREFEDSTAKEGVTYYYIVKAVLPGNKQSEPSNETAATIKKTETNKPVPAKTVIVLQVGNPLMTVNGVSKEIDPGNGTSPAIFGTRTFLPIRSVIDELKGTVGWDGNESKVTVTLNNKKVELWIGKATIKVNGKEEEMDVVPQIVNGRPSVFYFFDKGKLLGGSAPNNCFNSE